MKPSRRERHCHTVRLRHTLLIALVSLGWTSASSTSGPALAVPLGRQGNNAQKKSPPPPPPRNTAFSKSATGSETEARRKPPLSSPPRIFKQPAQSGDSGSASASTIASFVKDALSSSPEPFPLSENSLENEPESSTIMSPPPTSEITNSATDLLSKKYDVPETKTAALKTTIQKLPPPPPPRVEMSPDAKSTADPSGNRQADSAPADNTSLKTRREEAIEKTPVHNVGKEYKVSPTLIEQPSLTSHEGRDTQDYISTKIDASSLPPIETLSSHGNPSIFDTSKSIRAIEKVAPPPPLIAETSLHSKPQKEGVQEANATGSEDESIRGATTFAAPLSTVPVIEKLKDSSAKEGSKAAALERPRVPPPPPPIRSAAAKQMPEMERPFSSPIQWQPPLMREQQKSSSMAYQPHSASQYQYHVPMRTQGIHQQPPHHNRMPPQRRRPLPNHRYYNAPSAHPNSSSAAGSSGIRSIWSRVEKGLDGLANFEDAITGRAQQLVSTAITKSVRQAQPTTPQEQRRPIRTVPKRAPASQPLLGPQLRWKQQQERQQTTLQERASSQATDTRIGRSSFPSISLHECNKAASSPDANRPNSVGSSRNIVPIPKISRSDPLSSKARKLMPANGGASNPIDSNTWTYPGENKYSTSLPSTDQTNALGPSEGTRPVDPVAENASGLNGPNSAAPPHASAPPMKVNPLPRQATRVKPGKKNPSSYTGSGQGALPPSGRDRDGPWPQGSTTSISNGRSGGNPRPKPTTVVSPPSTYSDDDDDGRPSLFSRLAGLISVPPIGKLLRFKRSRGGDYGSFDAWDAEDEDIKRSGGFFGRFRRRKDATNVIVAQRKKPPNTEAAIAKPVQSLMDRSKEGKTASLLSAEDKKGVRRLGKSRAILDVISLMFFLVGIRQLHGLEHIPFPNTIGELGSTTMPELLSSLIGSFDSWAPLAFAAAILTVTTNSLLFDGRIQRKANDVATEAEAEAGYGRLFVRLVLSTPSERSLPEKIFRAARLQVMALADLSRLRSFVVFTISTIILMTVAFVRPFILTVIGSFIHVVTLPDWRSWPLPVDSILANMKDTICGLGNELKTVIEVELRGIGHHPMQVAFKASILAAMVVVAYLPALELKRTAEANNDDLEEQSDEAVHLFTERLENIGASSAGRLGILSKSGRLENVIERWNLMKDESSSAEGDISVGSLFKRLGYYIASWCLLAAPILLFGFFFDTPMTGWSAAQMPRWESLLEVSVLILFTSNLLWSTIGKVVESTSMRPDFVGFLKSVSRASNEMTRHNVAPRPFSGSPNPTSGLLVKDLWAAHEVKRAWAIRAAHLSCRAGEVVVVLADDGGGKTKLLTTIAESIVSPPREALTARVQRGSVALGGIDVTKWDPNQLRRRVGLFLNDINTMSNMAGIWSGLSLEEILEPGDGLKLADPTRTSGAAEKSCMIRALKITGLYWSLLPRLPTKLSSVVSANEEDLRPSPLRPRYHVLSPTEWSKLMLAKLIAQALFDNENSSGSSDQLDGSLVGSLFLLDEATTQLSESEEAKLLQDLRRTGAATVLSSNKWAAGRLANRIIVMKDGTVIESGTHHELLSRGPQQSIYAAKWNALTSF